MIVQPITWVMCLLITKSDKTIGVNERDIEKKGQNKKKRLQQFN